MADNKPKKKFESQIGREARSRVDRIKTVVAARTAELQKLLEDEEAAKADLVAAEQHEASILVYANNRGYDDPELAEKALEAEAHKLNDAPPATDAMAMSPAQYRAHREKLGIA